jgi:homopolymeric O-antigen transport system ATP-binding protein
MTPVAISARGLGKRYRIGRRETGFEHLRRALIHRRAGSFKWAVDDLTFDIHEGDAVAVIGRNGAGKSTLLKLLARITEPTRGYVDMVGRVGALLEIGTGFHGELTGRENVYLNGAILGMTRSDVRRKFDEIVEFSGVGAYIDTPVKWYSSGMYVRLAFAVAAHLEPDILIVDEVLAVGDAEFQKRSLGRMGAAVQEGRTVLFVSHNMQAVRRLCRNGIMLEGGKLVEQGSVEVVANRYLASIESADAAVRRWEDPETRPGDDLCRIVEIRIADEEGRAASSYFSSKPIVVTIEFDLTRVDAAFGIGFDVATFDGVTVFRTWQLDAPDAELPLLRPGRNALQCVIPPGLLNFGRYVLNLRSWLHNTSWIAHEDAVLQFDVIADHGESLYQDHSRPGVVAPALQWIATDPASSLEEIVADSLAADASR